MATRTTSTMIGAALAAVLATQGTARAGGKVAIRIGHDRPRRVVEQTCVCYRTIRVPVEVTTYRTEQRVTIRHETQRRLVRQTVLLPGGRRVTRKFWKTVVVPVRHVTTVRVPVKQIVYKEVRVPVSTSTTVTSGHTCGVPTAAVPRIPVQTPAVVAPQTVSPRRLIAGLLLRLKK